MSMASDWVSRRYLFIGGVWDGVTQGIEGQPQDEVTVRAGNFVDKCDSSIFSTSCLVSMTTTYHRYTRLSHQPRGVVTGKVETYFMVFDGEDRGAPE